jgi:hypothetical protein
MNRAEHALYWILVGVALYIGFEAYPLGWSVLILGAANTTIFWIIKPHAVKLREGGWFYLPSFVVLNAAPPLIFFGIGRLAAYFVKGD